MRRVGEFSRGGAAPPPRAFLGAPASRRLLKRDEFSPFLRLAGQEIVRWVGAEVAVSGGEPVDEGEPTVYSPVCWYHESVPYLQLTWLDIQLADGRELRLLAQLDDGREYYGFYLVPAAAFWVDEPLPRPPWSIYRTRELTGLPTGTAHVSILRADGPHAVIEFSLSIGSDSLSFLAAEVYEQFDGTLRIVEADENILLQLNGAMPQLADG